MAFPPSFLAELKQRLSLVEELGSRIRLIKHGREYKALCPFHNEKTPSFTVSPDKGFYHCFGCGASGDALNFVMEYDKQPFVDTVKTLAEKYGLPVPQDSVATEKASPRAYQILEEACRWFEANLRTAHGKVAHAYVQGRGLSEATISAFRLGFAPDSWDGLLKHLTAKGFSEPERAASGLFIRNDQGRVYDRFRGRVMFPIVNRQGQVIAFGGRVLDKSEPKYLNSPETDLFHKGHQLYNFAKAAAAGRKAEQLFVVEGYMDVIGLAQAGIAQAVAPLGTALTETQLQLCWQVVDAPTLCFDGDGAGQRAMARAIERALPLLKPSKSLQFLTLPVGEDPDSYVRKHGAEALYALAYQALPLPEQLYRFTCQGSATASPEQKAGLKKALIEVAQRIADTDIQQFYKDTLLQWFDRDFRPRFTPRYGKAAGVVAAPRLNTTLDTNVNANKRRRYEALLAAIVNHPHILDSVDEELGQLNIPYSDLDKLRHLIIQAYSTTQEGATLARLFAENSSLQALCNQAIYSICRFAAPHFDGDVVARWRNVANLPQGADKNAFFNEKLRLRENNGS